MSTRKLSAICLPIIAAGLLALAMTPPAYLGAR